MSMYLVQATYTSETWATFLKHPQNRTQAVHALVEKLGGTVHGFWLASGSHDVVGICEMPSSVSAAAFAMAGLAGGALETFKTTPLMGMDDAVEAMKMAASSGYQPPNA